MEEWKVIQLKEVCELIPGFAFKSSEFGEHDYSAVKIGDIQPPYVREEGLTGVDISRYSKEKLEKFKVYYGDFVLAMTGATIGKIGRYIGTSGAYINQRVLLFRPKENVNKEYLYYCLQTPVFQQYIFNHIDSQTAQPNISAGSVSGFEILLPGISVQNKIANILSALDSKIELNNRINHNLEEQAQALYKSWFVDFEPFRGGKFVDSELGLIPEGWNCISLTDISMVFDSMRKPLSGMQRENMKKLYPYYGATEIMDYVDNYIFDGIYLLIGEDGSVVRSNGAPFLQYVEGKFWSNNHAHVLQGTNGYSTEMLHCALLNKNIKHAVTGAVQAKLSQSNMRKILLVLPPKDVSNGFDSIIQSIYNSKRTIERENNNLSKQRDNILPKLMSGELKINDFTC